uniref:Translocation protein SEC62 n=1 Tax=Amphimedon queenslandica TaxID=400682 RepID=A0A1X7VNR9_AMPQE
LIDGGYLVGGKKIEMKLDKKGDDDEEDTSTDSKDSKKKVRRFRIEWLPVKDIKDSSDEIYIWRYEVPQRYTWVIGLILLLGVIGFTLQPLWPDSSKLGMWFLSVIMMILLGILLALYIVRWFLYALVLTFTSGKVVFWLLPNLDDDKMGVIDSFKPFYSVKYKKKKKKQDKAPEKDEKSKKEE